MIVAVVLVMTHASMYFASQSTIRLQSRPPRGWDVPQGTQGLRPPAVSGTEPTPAEAAQERSTKRKKGGKGTKNKSADFSLFHNGNA